MVKPVGEGSAVQHPFDAAGPGPAFSRVTLAEQVYEHLRQGILANAYPPDTPLPEEALAARLHVSRVPVREALRRLASDGLVNLVPRQGAVVSSLSPKQFLDAYRLREALEALAIRLAMPLLTADDIQALEWRQAEMRAGAAERDFEQFFTANAAFHALFVERSDNDYLRAVYEPLIDQMRRYRSPSADLRGGLERSIDEHEGILNAIKANDVEEAVRRLIEHIRVPQRILEASGDEPLATSR
ncbi:MAG: GntR family transcriptional regulator [Thermomicrobiales bacterium]|nr:GntR family transcriptional regulator [Thermomicrobiales bacterium]